MRKSFSLGLATLVTAALPTLSSVAIASQALTPGENRYTVIINNTCHRDIRVAVHYRHPVRGWVTEGWWEVAGNSELATGITSDHHQFYMHGDTPGNLQWPPERSRKQYNHYSILQEDFFLEENNSNAMGTEVPFSLKEIPPQSSGLKARFDC